MFCVLTAAQVTVVQPSGAWNKIILKLCFESCVLLQRASWGAAVFVCVWGGAEDVADTVKICLSRQ